MVKIKITEIFDRTDVPEWEPWNEGTLMGWDWVIQYWEDDDDQDNWDESELPATWIVDVVASPFDEVITVR